LKPAAIALALAGALWLPLAAVAAPPAVAARIDGAPLLSFSVDAMWRMAPPKTAAAGRQALLDTLIDNRLLATAARRRFGVDALSSGQRVAFARDVAFDAQLVATLRSVYGPQMEKDLQRLAGGAEGLVRVQLRPDAAALADVFGKPGGLLLGVALDPGQIERARQIVLLRYALPNGAERTITLLDVYQRQNVQGRVALFSHDVDFMLQQARLEVAAQYVLDWSQRRFGIEAVADLRRVLSEQADTQALLRMHGIGADGHAGGAVVDELVHSVSAAQVRQYYQRHRAQFVRIERVRARHIRLPDEASAQAAAAALAGGADFAAVARRHSVAPDAARGGALGWIRHSGTPDWLAQLLFAQADGQVSVPVRAPAGPNQAAAWEIVLVEQREQGYQEAGSESVRYAASRAIAQETAVAQLTALRKQVRRNARVDIPSAQPQETS
jgi:hypothetical protein